MLNQVILVGRIKTIEDNNLVLNIPRAYKNENGEYDVDVIPVRLSGMIFENTKQYCQNNDVVGVKGRLTSHNNQVIIDAEKITFLSSSKINNEGGENEDE